MASRLKRRRKHRYAAPIGGAFILFALIGIVTVVFLSIRLTYNTLDNSKQSKELEKLILPVVMFNPVPFESAESISNANLLNYSMWSALTSAKRKTYTYNDMQELVIPASDLEVEAFQLFGDVVKLDHQTFGSNENIYSYDSKTKLYSVPSLAELYVYTPRVTKIVKNGDYYDLYVDYIPLGNAWTISYDGDMAEPSAEKTMIYVMSKEKSSWHIVKVKDLPKDELAGSANRE